MAALFVNADKSNLQTCASLIREMFGTKITVKSRSMHH